MRKTFNTIRQKVNNMFPYIVKYNGEVYYLFEIDKNMSLRKIICVRKAFKGMNLIFATAHIELIDATCMKDAASIYVPIYKTPIFYYDGKDFFHIEEYNRNEGFIDLGLTKHKSKIECISNKMKSKTQN